MTVRINRGKNTTAAKSRLGKGTAPAAGIECRKTAASAVRRKHRERMQRRGRAALSAPRQATPIQPGFSPSGRGGEL